MIIQQNMINGKCILYTHTQAIYRYKYLYKIIAKYNIKLFGLYMIRRNSTLSLSVVVYKLSYIMKWHLP